MDEEQLLREQYEEGGRFESPDYPSEELGCGRYLYIFLGIVAIFIAISAWRYYALIGTFPTQGGYLNIVNAAEVELDTKAIEEAARLLDDNFGITIDVYIFELVDDDYSLSFWGYRDFVTRRDYGSLRANHLVLVIGINEQYSEITWGANLDRLDGDRIRGEVMNPRLNERDYTGALVRSFEAMTQRLQDGSLVWNEIMRGYFEYTDKVLILGAIILFIIFSFYVAINNQGSDDGDSGGSYRSRSSWTGFRSSSSSGGSRSSSSGRSSGGGSSRGSWKS